MRNLLFFMSRNTLFLVFLNVCLTSCRGNVFEEYDTTVHVQKHIPLVVIRVLRCVYIHGSPAMHHGMYNGLYNIYILGCL